MALPGSAAGLSAAPVWQLPADPEVGFGSAGDANSDGFDDLFVRTDLVTRLFLGSVTGPSATPIWTASTASAAAAGDVGQGVAVTFEQLFGSSLDANLHFHSLVLDGLGGWTVAYRRNYVPEPRHRTEPDASALLAPSLDHPPPASLIVAECDVLRDESLAYAEANGPARDLDLVPGALQGFLSLLCLSEARAALSRGSEWLDTAFRAP